MRGVAFLHSDGGSSPIESATGIFLLNVELLVNVGVVLGNLVFGVLVS